MDTTDTSGQTPDMGVPDLARAADVHEQTVRSDIRTGTLPADKVSGVYVIAGPDAAEYIRARNLVKAAEAALAGIRAKAQERAKRGPRNAR